MAGGMKPESVLVHDLFQPLPLDLLLASSTDRVRNRVAALHEPTLHTLHSRAHAMFLTQREQIASHQRAPTHAARKGSISGRTKGNGCTEAGCLIYALSLSMIFIIQNILV